MPREREIALKCQINAGGFSGERIAVVNLSDGNEQRVLAPRHYCWTAEGSPLAPDQPPLGNSIVGLVAARRIQDLPDGNVFVSTPDGAVFAVKPKTIDQRPATLESVPHVPVR